MRCANSCVCEPGSSEPGLTSRQIRISHVLDTKDLLHAPDSGDRSSTDQKRSNPEGLRRVERTIEPIPCST